MKGLVGLLLAGCVMAAAACGAAQRPTSSPPLAKGPAWCSHMAGLTKATNKPLAEGLPILATVAADLRRDSEALQTQGHGAAGQFLATVADQLQKDHDLIQERGYTISLVVEPDGGFLFGDVPQTTQRAVEKELLDVPGVQSAAWVPNAFTVRFDRFVTWEEMRKLGSLPHVMGVTPDVGIAGLDPTQADQQDVGMADLKAIGGCDPRTALDASTLPALP